MAITKELRGSVPVDFARNLASGPHLFGDSQQAAQTLNLPEKNYILVYAPRKQFFYLCPDI